MHLNLSRFSTSTESTLGTLSIDGKFECYTLEDTKRATKVAGETRIPPGRYELSLRNSGGLTKRYAKKYEAIHKGMLWLKNVPGFYFIYIHTGNKRGHTEGCILVGDSLNNNSIKEGFVGSSRDAYVRLYQKVIRALLSEAVTIRINNMG
jgi:hypothetical protein